VPSKYALTIIAQPCKDCNIVQDAESIRLAVSVGGSKCAFAAVGAVSHAVLARSGRVEWTGRGIATLEAFTEMLATEFQNLLREAGIDCTRVEAVGVAWPGPHLDGLFQATFIPGCRTPRPVGRLLQRALARALSPRLESVPVGVMLDALARAAGETTPGGALDFSPATGGASGMLVNIATGIAGGIVRNGQPLISHPGFGNNYGQFGRFLFLDTGSGAWLWRPAQDGSVPRHSSTEIRWTRYCAGPALAHRVASWCFERGVRAHGVDEAITEALQYYRAEPPSRHVGYEMALLHWTSAEAAEYPDGQLAKFVKLVAAEIGAALRVLLQVFASERIWRIVLAGGVGENFGRADGRNEDPFLDLVKQTAGEGCCDIARARLGVDAEFLGLARIIKEVAS
jgi:predicted NBD/HSP70 family sugar kinase